MEFAEYKSCVERVPFGKRLPGAVYVLRQEGVGFGEPLDSLLRRLVTKYGKSTERHTRPRNGLERGREWVYITDHECSHQREFGRRNLETSD